jgi:hypothetical protein
MKRIGQFVLLTSSALLLSVSSTSAQKHQTLPSVAQNSTYTISNQVAGRSDVTVYTGAPAGFDPGTASDEFAGVWLSPPSRPK